MSAPVKPDERLEAYARLAVRVGANVSPGQLVQVLCLVEHAPLARAIVREAYAAGASYVEVTYGDAHTRRAAIELGPEEMLGHSPAWMLDRIAGWGEQERALVSLTGDPEPELFADLDGTLVAKSQPREIQVAYLKLVSARKLNWTIVAAPNEGWARQVFGEPDLERLWQAVATAVRLDEPDPVAAWRGHVERLGARCAQLNERAFDAIRFRGPGTDLSVGLIHGARRASSARRSRSRSAARSCATSSCASRAGARSRSRRPRARTSSVASLRRIPRRRCSARSHSWTASRRCARAGSSSRTRSSTRPPRATSPTDTASPVRSRAPTPSRPRSCSSAASTSPASTPTSW